MDMTSMGADSDSEGSAQSCISYEDEGDASDEESVALEVVNYLPQEKAHKLLGMIRGKERVIQDLLRRNQSLLNTCNQLDQENQSATERCDELVRQTERSGEIADEQKSSGTNQQTVVLQERVSPAAAPVSEDAKPKVDTSYFMKLEQGKEEKILRLQAENQRLASLHKHSQERMAQMESRVEDLMKESKQFKKKLQAAESGQRPASGSAPARQGLSAEVDEEERLFQKECVEAQSNAQCDMMARRMWDQMLEQRKKLAQMLEQVLSRDVLGAVCGWDSELSALDMQVEGLEKCLGGVGKGLRAPAAASEQAGAAMGSKKKQQSKKAEDSIRLDSAWADETFSHLLDHFEAMRGNLDTVDSARHSFQEASKRLVDGTASEVADAMDLEGTFRSAEAEAEWIREHNAAWVEKATHLGLDEVVALVDQVQAAAQNLQSSAPPGILPPAVLEILSANTDQLGTLRAQLASQASVMAGLQAESINVGRRVRQMQNELKTGKSLLRERVLQGISAQLRPVSDAESRLGDALRRQRSLEDKARSEASTFFEDLSSALKRHGGSLSSSAGGGTEATSSAVAAAKESHSEATRNAKEVRAALATLRATLSKIHTELGDKLSAVLSAVAGEPEKQSSMSAAAIKETAESDSKGKKSRKKKGKAVPEAIQQPAAGFHDYSRGGDEAPGKRVGAAEAVAIPADSEQAPRKPLNSKSPKTPAAEKAPVNEDAALRAELAREFANEGNKPKKVVSGKDLMRQIKELKSASDSLEERIAARVAKKASEDIAPSEVSEERPVKEEAPQTVKSTLRKKKMLYA